MKVIFNIFCKPRCIYRAIIIFISAVILYAIIFSEEVSEEEFVENISSARRNKIPHDSFRREDFMTKFYDEKNEFNSENRRMKYILLWTPNVTPFNKIKERGRKPFISSGCKYKNCFLTRRRQYFQDQTKFDAIVFSIAALKNLQNLPTNRSLRQKFVAASKGPPEKYPVINPMFDGYFNWTWTYRLKSDILWRYFRIFNSMGKEVGPKKDMKWLKKYAPSDYILDDVETAFRFKNKAVMWTKTCCNCKSLNNMEQLKYIMDLEKELGSYGLSLTTYSNCTGYNNSCGDIFECNELVNKDHYFYLAFEDYFDDDYVTDILLFAIQNFAVPVVMGNANYSRFLPPDSYLDAKKLSAKALAKVIDDSINCNSFSKYFRWIHHYKYESTGIQSEICNICTALNNKKMVESDTVYDNFRKMWNGENSVLVSDFLLDVFENDEILKRLMRNGNYTDIRKMFKKRYLADPRDSVFVFDMEGLNLTSTEETFIIPYEITTDTTNN